jgi:type IV pilus assembly protein PilB
VQGVSFRLDLEFYLGINSWGAAISYLTEILVIRGVLPMEEMDNVVDGWKGDEESVRQMVELGKVSAADFAWAKAVQQGIPFVELTEHPVDRVAVSLVPAAICRRHEVLPIAVDGSCLTLAVVDPRNVFALDDVRAAVRMQVTVVVAERGDLLAAIDRYHRVDGELSSLTTVFEEESTSQAEELNLSDSEPGQDDEPAH